MPGMSLKLSLAALLVVGTSLPALAQPADPEANAQYEQQLRDYRNKQDQYQAQRQDYEDQSADAQARRDTYSVQKDRYAQERGDYERQREDYDARYGAGAWERRYGGYDYHRDSDAYGRYASSPCERGRNSSAATGGVIGALAGAAIGSNIAGRGDRTAGAVLGAVAGGAAGAAIGGSTAQCDTEGYWFSYDQTYPYREAAEAHEGWRYDRDRRRGCRLALAPAYVDGRTEDRYVRVCPDSDGRYRITG